MIDHYKLGVYHVDWKEQDQSEDRNERIKEATDFYISSVEAIHQSNLKFYKRTKYKQLKIFQI